MSEEQSVESDVPKVEVAERVIKEPVYKISPSCFPSSVLVANIPQHMQAGDIWDALQMDSEPKARCAKTMSDPRGLFKQAVILSYEDEVVALEAIQKLRSLIQDQQLDYNGCLLSDFVALAPHIAQRRRPTLTTNRDCEVELLNVNPELTQQELTSIFSKYGTVVEVHVTDKTVFHFHRAVVRMSSYAEALTAELCVSMEKTKNFKTCARTGLNVDRIRCLAAVCDELTMLNKKSSTSSDSSSAPGTPEQPQSVVVTYSMYGIRRLEILTTLREYKWILYTMDLIDFTAPQESSGDASRNGSEDNEISYSPMESEAASESSSSDPAKSETLNVMEQSTSSIDVPNIPLDAVEEASITAKEKWIADQRPGPSGVEREETTLIGKVLGYSDMISDHLSETAAKLETTEEMKRRELYLLGALEAFFDERRDLALNIIREQQAMDTAEDLLPIPEGFQWVFEKPETEILSTVQEMASASHST